MLEKLIYYYVERLSIFLIIVTLIVGMVGCACARPTTETHVIENWYDLDAIRTDLSGSYILKVNLNYTTPGYNKTASATAHNGEGWWPIGVDFGEFRGVFDGNGHEIRDLVINAPDKTNVGLFGYVDTGGVVKNISVVNANVTGKEHVGGLVGRNDGAVINSYSSGNVKGDKNVGGLVGWNYALGEVSASHSTASVTGKETGDNDVGGLVGWNDGEMSASNASGSVKGNKNVGGLVGWNDGEVSDSHSTSNVEGELEVGGLVGRNCWGTVSDSHSTGNVTGDTNVGGLVGRNSWGTVSDSYSIGNVTGEEHVGGLLGRNDGAVSDSDSIGCVTGTEDVGGLVGHIHTGAVSNSYSTGSVTGEKDVGGLIGYRHGGAVSNSFWDKETSGMEVSTDGTGKTTAEMKDITTFTVWEIVPVAPETKNGNYTWNIINGQTYPFLS